jgi:hypothetical protein
MTGIGFTPSGPVVAEDVRNPSAGRAISAARQAPEPQGCVPRQAADEEDQSPVRCTAS